MPQKALAEEKYREFRAKYGPRGIRVVIPTRGRTKEALRKSGHFHFALTGGRPLVVRPEAEDLAGPLLRQQRACVT